MEPSKVAQFFIERPIAQGGQAKVYEASKNSNFFAIKIYYSANEKENLLFLQEKELMESLNHPGIFCPLEYRAQQPVTLPNQLTQNKNVVIMNYMRNGDLMNFVIKNGRLEPSIILRLARSVLECLEYLSSQGVYHCDLKPENILLDQHYRPLLIDFGYVMSKSLSRQKDYPKQYYIAPEVKRGQPYNQKSQAFSLGVLIFILTVGCLPFKHTKHTDPSYRSLLEGKHNIFWKQFEQNLNFPLCEKLKQVIINLMEPNPKRRWSFSQLKESDWLSEDLVSQKEYFQYFQEKSADKIKKQESQCEFPFTDNDSAASKETTGIES